MSKFQQVSSKWLGCLNKKICYEQILELDFAKKCIFWGICFQLRICCIVKHNSTSKSFYEVGVVLHQLCKNIHKGTIVASSQFQIS
jgi:hypothetical protein